MIQADALLWLAVKAIAIAALPLGYVWRSRDPYKFQKLAWVTAFLTLDLVMFGSFTRLTDSGLGCPDWPGCYGHSNPLSAGEPILAAQTAQPTGPVTMIKAWIEMLHRYFAMAVGFLITVLMVLSWVHRSRGRQDSSPWLATAIFFTVCLQGAFGAWTVTMKLQPAIVTAHLLGGIILLSLLTWLALRESAVQTIDRRARQLRNHAAVGLALLMIQVALGGWVSSNYAVLACPDFPLCQGRVVPEADFLQGFTLWRKLGMTGDGVPISFQSLVAIHWMHRAFALAVLAVLALLAWRARHIQGLRRPVGWLALLLAVQFLTGLSNVVLQWPLVLAVAHSGGAALLVATMVVILFRIAAAGRTMHFTSR